MMGKKICIEYSGMRRECSNCYGPHPKKYCKSERVGMENFVEGFSKKYGHVPGALYGKFAKPEKRAESATATAAPPTRTPVPLPAPAPVTVPGTSSTKPTSVRPKIKIALKRNGENDWIPTQSSDQSRKVENDLPGVTSVVENVSSFLNGIRASFRQDNVIVAVNQKKQAEEWL